MLFMEALVPLAGVFMVFVAFPWIILHYVTQWKKAGSLTVEDEKLLDELHELARRLDDRTCTIERIMAAENPNWRALGCDPAAALSMASREQDETRRIK